jgi:hypothetical protein
MKPTDRSAAATDGLISDEVEFAGALLSVGAVADRAMVTRTLRRVRTEALVIEERRQRTRRAVGVAILGFSLLLLVLTPVLWGGFHAQLDEGWSAFTAVDLQQMYVIAWLFPVTMAGLIMAFAGARRLRSGRRSDHRVTSRLASLVR